MLFAVKWKWDSTRKKTPTCFVLPKPVALSGDDDPQTSITTAFSVWAIAAIPGIRIRREGWFSYASGVCCCYRFDSSNAVKYFNI